MNNYRYFFRLRAYNGFQPSIPSENISVHPIGDVPKEVLNLTAECFSSNNSEQFRCQTGFVGDTRVSISWLAPFQDDSVTDVLGYKVEVSDDDAVSWEPYIPQSEKDPITRSYTISCLLNDKAYMLRIAALNLYGVGGPLTPRWCPHLLFCGKCLEPFFDVWGGCQPPKCVASLSPRSEHTRLTNCSDFGCRVEVFHKGILGRVNGLWPNSSAEVACRSLGLRGRPTTCGSGDGVCGASVGKPTIEAAKGLVWLTNVSCGGWENAIAQSKSNLTANESFSTAADYKRGYDGREEFASNAGDAGVCCWSMPKFMEETGIRTAEAYGQIFRTISSLDRSGNEIAPDFCCQEVAGLCSDGMMVQDVPRETRCYASSAQRGRCTYARGPFEVTKVEQVPCDNNLTNCDEKATIKFEPPDKFEPKFNTFRFDAGVH